MACAADDRAGDLRQFPQLAAGNFYRALEGLVTGHLGPADGRHHPEQAHQAIAEIVGDAERRWNTPRDVSARSIRTALSLDGTLDKKARTEFLDLALPTEKTP